MLNLIPIERRTGISRNEFINDYLLPRKPVVLTDLSKDWPATEKWTPQFLKTNFGHLDVPVIGPEFHKPGAHYMKSQLTMKFGDYLDLIQQGPTEYRIFLWNVLDHAKELVKDVSNPTICDGWIDNYPFMFFGGQGAVTGLHYDIDCSHVFHTHFQTRKKIVLFDQNQNQLLYHQPFTVKSLIDPLKPNYDKYPALSYAVGHETVLNHGETLFIPSLWWHHIVYLEGGYSISLRSNDQFGMKARGLWNITRHFVIDKGMNALWGQGWNDWKEKRAFENAQQAMQERFGHGSALNA